ncbi:uncharacterized protein LOC120359585 [Solenopsis invicta]|uniref:uncharacterized protein LOC120359585 n=1 Tax=Solenopsis invicta TaxID=13686 RepID=UPI0005960481|nr:uncharacterized protein LOC120359585 [Solenopsis invicta]
MTDRIKFILQKRASLKSQITGLTNIIERERYDKTALKLRMTRITELYHAYEEFNDELMLLESNDNHNDEFTSVQDRYYLLAAKVNEIIKPNEPPPDAIAGPSNVVLATENAGNTVTTKRKIKLPETALPTFDGRYEEWLTFKNTFLEMIDVRTDLADTKKLQYLKSALKGDAANKIKLLTIEGASYSKAWELLTRAYEVKRILISRHLTLLNNLPALEKETTDGLSRLADDTQQHVASLNALGVNVASESLVNLLESKLPKNTAEKWEETLDRDEFPKIDDLYKFLYRTAVRVSKRTRIESNRREDDKSSTAGKRARLTSKAFVVNNCTACGIKQHPLFKCDKFRQLDISKRIEIVRKARLCYNCMRSHVGKTCKYTNCTICHKRHNTLLHLERKTNAEGSGATDSKTAKDE